MQKTITLLFAVLTVHCQAFTAKLTAYNWHERDHRAYGDLNCQGQELEVGMCAADLHYHPLGQRIDIDGMGVYTVADCGSDVNGPNHLDIYVDSLRACNQFGVRYAQASVVGSKIARRRQPSKPAPVGTTDTFFGQSTKPRASVRALFRGYSDEMVASL